MKKLQTAALAITLITLFASCQSTSAQTSTLSNSDTRNEIMKTIANDSMMCREMIGTMMNNKNGTMMMQHQQMMMMENHGSMMTMLKANPGMMQGMFSEMMETARGDSSMMHGMVEMMKANPQMMQMMQNKPDHNMMNGMQPMHGMKH